MKNLTMMMGLPRSGKSTWVQNRNSNELLPQVPIVSADQFRLLMYGTRFYAEGESMVWATRDICLTILLQQGVDIIVDETNLTIASRAKIIKLAKKYDYNVHGVYMNTEPLLCAKRAIESGQEDLIPVIGKMIARAEAPTLEEGFRTLSIANLEGTRVLVNNTL